MASDHVIVVGASAGGVRALQALAAQLPAGFPAPTLVVQHVGSHPSIMPRLLARSGPLPAAHAEDGAKLEPGRIYVAPPDQHMLVEGGRLRVVHGPKENHARPAIDPLFRSAAVSFGSATIGVLLTGLLDDGTAGLQAVKACGGTAVVQDPRDAEEPSMPLSALRHVEVDHCVPLAQMGELLVSLTQVPSSRQPPPSTAPITRENEILLGKGDFMEHLTALGKPSRISCPDCHGTLFELEAVEPRRFRCHTGHGYTLRSLHHAHAAAVDDALWSALRALQEKELLLESMREADAAEPERLKSEMELTARDAEALRALIERVRPPAD